MKKNNGKKEDKNIIVLLIKITIIIFVLLLATGVIMVMVGACLPETMPPYSEICKKIDTLVNYINIWIFIDGGIYLVLLFVAGDTKLNTPKMTEPDVYKISKYKTFFNSYQKELKSEGYISYKFQYPNYKIDYFVKNEKNDTLILFIELEELTKDVYSNYSDSMFQELGEYIINNDIVDFRKQINIYVFIKVDKQNKIFEKYISTPSIQDSRRSVVSVGINCENESIFIVNYAKGVGKKLYCQNKEKLYEKIKKYFN